jgi:hypothetical protein
MPTPTATYGDGSIAVESWSPPACESSMSFLNVLALPADQGRLTDSEVDHTHGIIELREGADMSESKSSPEERLGDKQLAEAARVLRETRTGLVLTGRIKNGKLELDQPTLDEIQQKYPEADVSFIALNSPFDAKSLAV